ncbi:hypothetical protein ACSBOX_02445 [Arthrobacter sp. KN11-1C]|uniref:hypothetical protein n=1 Tax=Arthrobacter sp. KN11-1C TaxID=3445774 RepID=UPI003FA17F59
MVLPFVVRRLISISVLAGLVTASVGVSAFALPAEPELRSEITAATQARISGQDVLVEELTTATEHVVAKPDGRLEKTLSSEPVRMKKDGAWRDISTDLSISYGADGAVLRPAMTPVQMEIGAGGSDHMAVIDDGQGRSVKEKWPFGPLPTPVVTGNTATYQSVLPRVDLVQVAHSHGVSQVLKIHDRQAAEDPRVARMRFNLDTRGVEVESDGVGGIVAKRQSDGKEAFSTSKGQWWDSSHPDADATDPGGPGITRPFNLHLDKSGGKTAEVFGMDEILGANNVQFPIYVDPEWSAGSWAYLYVDSAYPSTSYWNGRYTDSTTHVGYLPASWAPDAIAHTTRSFWQFNISPMNGKKIMAAKFNVVETWASSCTPTPVSAWVTGAVQDGTNWNSQPNWSQAQHLDTRTVAYGYVGCGQATVGFDMMKRADWLGSNNQWTVGLKADNESDPLGWKRFANTAQVIITYGTAPNAPVLNSISGCGLTCAEMITRYNQPTLQLTADDPDGDPGGTIYIWISVFNTSGATVASTSVGRPVPGSGGSTTWQVPSSLSDGIYTLQYQTSDQQGMTSPVASKKFTVNTTAPAAPQIRAGDPAMMMDPNFYTNAVVGVTPVSYSIVNKGSTPVKGFVYAVTAGSGQPDYPKSAGALACGQRTGPFVVVCPTDGRSANVTVAAVGLKTTLSVWAFDYAGNVSLQTESEPQSVTFDVGKMAPAPATIAPVTVTSGAQWVDVPASRGVPSPVAGCMVPEATTPATTASRALRVPAAGAYAKTLEAAVDNSQSFSFSGWFCPTAPSATNRQVALGQLSDAGTVGSLLGLSTQHLWQLGAYDTSSPSLFKEVSQDLVEGAASQQWYFIGAVYDKINAQLRITISSTRGVKTWVIATAATSHTPSTGGSPAVLGTANPAQPAADQFTGLIYRPVMAQGTLVDSQFGVAWDAFPSREGILVK